MTNEDFDRLWERAEAGSHAARLAEEYPAWRTARRRNTGIVAGMALAVAVSLPLVNKIQPSEHIYCNNSAYSDSHWTEMADALLLEA